MKKTEKNILLVITFVIVGLLIASTVSVSAIRINKNENNIKIEKIQTELKTETLKCKSYNNLLSFVPKTTAIGEFEFEGDQLHPAFDLDEAGGYMVAYKDSEFENIMWTYTNDNAIYYDTEGGDYPSIKLWDGTRFFGTFVPGPDDSHGGIVYLFETTDPADWDNQYDLRGWDWSELSDYPGEIMWHDFIDMEIACDNSKETWEWGLISMVGSSNYGEGHYNAPFITYPTSDDGYATISWYSGLDGCAHTDNTIDHVSYEAYSVYDFLDPEDDTWKIFIRLDYYDDWDKDGAPYLYSGDADLKYPAVAANDGDILVVMESDDENKDILCFYGANLGTLDTSIIADTGDDERYPDVAHLTGDTYICTFTKNGNIYGVITENAGQTWGDPFQINDNSGKVIDEYKYSDMSSNGLQAMWQEDGYDSDIYYGSPSGNQPPQAATIDGPPSGKPEQNYDFTFKATDPEGDKICYYIDWGDGTDSGWVGPYNSGATVTLSHTWTEKQEFTITAKVRDVSGNRGPESTLPFSTPKNKAIIWNFLENFPFLSQFLKALFL